MCVSPRRICCGHNPRGDRRLVGQTVLPGQTHALWFVLAEAQLCPQGSGRGRASESPVISGTVHTHSPKDTGSDMHTLIPRPEGGDGPWAASPGCGVLGWHRPPSVGAPGSGCAGACVTVGRRSGSVWGRCVCRTSTWMAGGSEALFVRDVCP